MKPILSMLVLASGTALLPGSAAAALPAQTLQHRKPSAEGMAVATTAAAASAGNSDARGTLPADAEGEYRWGEAGEVIELYVEGGQLHGYMTRRSDRANPDSSPITFQFKDAGTSGGRLTFTTARIHGDWYAFAGRVLRGTATSPRQDGYYVLTGTLTTHLGEGSAADGVVGLPSAGGGMGSDTLTRQVSLKQAGAGTARSR